MDRVQQLLGVDVPVIAAPMTYIARAGLAAAVSEAGGMGIIETLTPEGRADLQRVRDLTAKPVGANLMIQGWKHDPSIVDVLVAGVCDVANTGLVSARIDEVLPVADVLREMWSGCQDALDAASARLG